MAEKKPLVLIQATAFTTHNGMKLRIDVDGRVYTVTLGGDAGAKELYRGRSAKDARTVFDHERDHYKARAAAFKEGGEAAERLVQNEVLRL